MMSVNLPRSHRIEIEVRSRRSDDAEAGPRRPRPESKRLLASGRRPGLSMTSVSDQRTGKSRDDFHKIGLATGAGFHKQISEVRLDRAFGNAEGRRAFGNPADIDDGEQHAQLARGQMVGAGDDFPRRSDFRRDL